jgi:hypothetical protein
LVVSGLVKVTAGPDDEEQAEVPEDSQAFQKVAERPDGERADAVVRLSPCCAWRLPGQDGDEGGGGGAAAQQGCQDGGGEVELPNREVKWRE